MSSVIVVSPKLEDAKQIQNLLNRRGIGTAAVCTTASAALSFAHQMESGVVIFSYRVSDMHYTQAAEYLPEYFEMLLLISPAEAENCPSGVMMLTLSLIHISFGPPVSQTAMPQASCPLCCRAHNP